MTRHYNQTAFERKDDGGNTAEAIGREIKKFGEDIKGLSDSVQKDLTAMRKEVEDVKKADPELEVKLTKMGEEIAAKHEALDALFKKNDDRMDEFETAMSRSSMGDGEDNGMAMKHAIEFFETKKASSGNLSWRDRPTADTVDMDGYKAWANGFEGYMRSEEAIESKALAAGRNPDGGYFVPTPVSGRIIKKIFESSPIREVANIESISSNSLDIRIDRDEADVEWAGEEEATGNTGTPQIGMQNIPVFEMRAKPKASQQMLEDSAVDVEAWLAEKVGAKMSRKEATAFVSGNGIKKPRGFLTYPAGTAGARGTIAQYNTGHATLLTSDAIVGLPFRLKSAYMARGSWMMNRLSVLQVMLLKDGNDQYLWRPGLGEGQPSTLSSFAVRMADDMPTLGAGSLSVAFGDWREAYTIVDRLGITTLRDPYSAKPFVEFYTRKRVGGDVTDFEALALLKTAA